MGGIHNGTWYATTAEYNAAVEADSAGQTVTQGTPWPYGPVGPGGVVPATTAPKQYTPPATAAPAAAPPASVPSQYPQPASPPVQAPVTQPKQSPATTNRQPATPTPAPAATGGAPMDITSAINLFQLALGQKAQYESYLASHPGATEGDNGGSNPLAAAHANDLSYEAQLRSGGYSEAADVLAGDNQAAAAQWFASNPGLGVANPQAAAPGGSSAPTAPSTIPLAYSSTTGSSGSTGGSEGLNGYSASPTANGGQPGTGSSSFLDAIGTMLSSIFTGQAGATVGNDLVGIGSGAGVGAAAAATGTGQGIGAGASSALSGIAQGAANLVKTLEWPIVIILGLVAFGKVYKIRVNKKK